MFPPLRRLVAVTALTGMLAPWAAVIGTAVHLAAGHHDSGDHDHFDASALHGHGHSADTPDHEHGMSVPGVTDSGLRPPMITTPLAAWAGFAEEPASPLSVPAPAASPPRRPPLVLRI